MHKKLQVHALPTKSSALYKSDDEWYWNEEGDTVDHCVMPPTWPHYLYWTIDGETKKGDLAYDPDMNTWGINGDSWNPKNRKIVVTTNPDLWYKDRYGVKNAFSGIGVIPQDFIKAFVEAQGIWEVMVEYELVLPHPALGGRIPKLKLNSDGTVIWKPVITPLFMKPIDIARSAYKQGLKEKSFKFEEERFLLWYYKNIK